MSTPNDKTAELSKYIGPLFVHLGNEWPGFQLQMKSSNDVNGYMTIEKAAAENEKAKETTGGGLLDDDAWGDVEDVSVNQIFINLYFDIAHGRSEQHE